jgi:hypothetical protein
MLLQGLTDGVRKVMTQCGGDGLIQLRLGLIESIRQRGIPLPGEKGFEIGRQSLHAKAFRVFLGGQLAHGADLPRQMIGKPIMCLTATLE